MFATIIGLGLAGLTSTVATPIASASQGNGNAPADGTVGKADDKNPNGQSSGDTPNSGYECDDQSGIGDGNPAHTGCAPASEPETPGTTGNGTPTVEVTTTPVGEVLAVSEEAPLPGTPASGEVAGETVTASEVQATAITAPAQLPFTGPGTLTYLLAAVGALMVLLGMVLVKATKEPAFA